MTLSNEETTVVEDEDEDDDEEAREGLLRHLATKIIMKDNQAQQAARKRLCESENYASTLLDYQSRILLQH